MFFFDLGRGLKRSVKHFPKAMTSDEGPMQGRVMSDEGRGKKEEASTKRTTNNEPKTEPSLTVGLLTRS